MKQETRSDTDHSNRGVVPGHCIQLTGETERVTIPGQATVSEPRIHLVRDGEVIRAIEITCPCGQRVRLRCVYEK